LSYNICNVLRIVSGLIVITYPREEIISSSKTAKILGLVLSNLKTGKLSRAVISRNNKLEAVILPIEYKGSI